METIKTIPREKVKFTFSTNMAKLLGRESVSSDIIAIFELVKNAYDSDSPRVVIKFQNIEQKNARIIIRDYGDGMTKNDILQKWMIIGTGAKEREKITRLGRRMIGEKGLGRFSAERLARKMTLISCPRKSKEVLELKVDWDLYEDEKKTFEEIEHELIIRPAGNPDHQGVEIILDQLRDNWNEKKINQLKNELSSLVLPSQFDTKHPFAIEVVDFKSEISEGRISSSLLAKAPYKLHAVLDDNKITISCSIKNKEVLSRKLHNNIIPNVSMRCGPTVFFYYGFPRDPSGSSIWKKYYGPVTEQRIEDMLTDHAGIRIYRDGFRVKPYGDPHNDWTRREDIARGRAGALPNDRTIGWVEINSDRNPQIIDTTTREKIIENDAFLDLVNFVDLCGQKLNAEIFKRRSKIFVRSKTQDIDRNFSRIKDSLKKIDMASEARRRVTKDVQQAQNIVKEREEVLMTKLEAYRNLATLGITSGVVSHEIGGDLAQIINIAHYLGDQDLSPKIRSNITDLSERASNIQSYMQMVRGYTSTLRSNSSNFRKKQVINCNDLVQRTLSGLSGVFQKNNIECEFSVEKNIPLITMFRTDFQSILINFLSNSIKSLKAKGLSRAGQKFSPEKLIYKIKVTCSTNGSNFIISVSDNGVGIDWRIKDTIFDVFTSYSMVTHIENDGSGLGLGIVKDIVEYYRGRVYVDTPQFGEGATLKVEIPLESVRG